MPPTLTDLVNSLRKVHGDALRTVAVYGSAAAGEHAPGHSDINVLVIVDDVPVSQLREEGNATREWVAAGNLPPFTLTSAEWRASADVFPMEYSDIQARHKVLHGEPPPGGVAVKPDDLRLELERESMGKLIHLRLGVMQAAGDPAREAELMLAAFSTFTAICRGLLRLQGMEVSLDDAEVIRSTASVAGFDAAPPLRVLEHRRGQRQLESAEVAGLMEGYVLAAARIADFVDRMWRSSADGSRTRDA